MLSHRVFAPLKFHSTWAEIWSVKNCRFPPSSCIPEGNFGSQPKPIERKNPMAEECGGGSGSRLCRERLGLPGQARRWPRGEEQQQHHFLCPHHPLPRFGVCFFFSLSSRVTSWGHRSWVFGEKESTGEWPGRAARGSRRQEKFVLPTFTVGIRSTDVFSLCTASPRFH